MAKAKMDPELRRQLSDAEKSARLGRRKADVQAVFTLAGADAPTEVPTREDTQRAVDGLLARARAASGTKATDVNVFANLGTFVVVGPPEFLRAVAEQPGVATAAPNRRAGLGLVAPRAKRAVTARRRPAP